MATLTFNGEAGLQTSQAVLSGDEGVVTFAIKMADDKPHRLLAQHSINGTNWQSIGTREFVDYAELSIDGLRPNIQYARVVILDNTKIEKAEYV